MGRPQVEIDVDDDTGRWSVDALPMVLVPQHFILNHHRVLEEELGAERLEKLFHPAGYRSAYRWCEMEADHHGLSGEAVFRHYLRRLSQRGWGQFDILALDPAAGTGLIRLRHSVFVDREKSDRRCCYRFSSWFEGALDFVRDGLGEGARVIAREAHCAASSDHDHCLFDLRPTS